MKASLAVLVTTMIMSFGHGALASAQPLTSPTQQPTTPITVAVLDTGITAHPALGWQVNAAGRGIAGGNVLPGFDFITDPWIAGDGDGWDADPSDLGDGVRANQTQDRPGCRPRVSSWHGTNVAGTIVAAAGVQPGIAGIAPAGKVLPVRILGRCGGNTADVAAAILWASGYPVDGTPVNANPARVINLSLSGPSAECPRSLQTAIDIADERGVVVVVAAGSSGVNTRDQTPANCSGVIVVGGVDRLGRRAPTSNFGREVTVSALGGNMALGETQGIYTTTDSGRFRPRAARYGYYQGSSAAAAYASGVIADLLSRRPELGPNDVRAVITDPRVLKPFKPAQCDRGKDQCGAGILELDRVREVYPANT